MRHHAARAALGLIVTCSYPSAALADAISVPEPNSMSLFAGAAIGLVLIACKFKRVSR